MPGDKIAIDSFPDKDVVQPGKLLAGMNAGEIMLVMRAFAVQVCCLRRPAVALQHCAKWKFVGQAKPAEL